MFIAAIRSMGDWVERGKCRTANMPVDYWYPDHGDNFRPALRICFQCPVRKECLQHALFFPELVGIWGGMTAGARVPYRKLPLPAAEVLKLALENSLATAQEDRLTEGEEVA
jgi:WhiB family redox-sensing transcriptional regulator